MSPSQDQDPTRDLAHVPAQDVDTVVFDVGNVLIRWDPRNLYRKMIPESFADEAAMERFLAEVCTPDWNLEQDRGRSWAEAVAERTARHPDHAELIRAFDERWMEMVPGAIESSVAVLRDLKAAGAPVYAITNFSAEKWDETIARFDFFALFDGIIVSAHERLVKPDAAIYRLCFERFGITPSRAVFIDDSAVNVAGSEATGMRAIRFHQGVDLRAALMSLGLRFSRLD